MDLDRQEIPRRAGSKPEPPQRVPESNPPVLGDWFIYLSVVVLVCGVIAITALNFGATPTSAIVRFPAVIAIGLLIPLSADACCPCVAISVGLATNRQAARARTLRVGGGAGGHVRGRRSWGSTC